MQEAAVSNLRVDELHGLLLICLAGFFGEAFYLFFINSFLRKIKEGIVINERE